MASDKIIRFLNSIGIKNIDDFDMDFEMVSRNRFNHNRVDMIIVKKTPWEYELSHQFIDALSNVNYEYTLAFGYLQSPNSDNVVSLLKDWYQSIYKVPLDLRIDCSNKNIIKIKYCNEQEQADFVPIIKDFKDYLQFLNYDFVVKEVLEPFVKKTKEEVEELEKAALENSSQETSEDIDPKDNIKKHEDINEEVEASLEEKMKQNYEQMLRDRERYRLNKRGNYKPIDLIDALNSNSGSVDINGRIYLAEVNENPEFTRLKLGLVDSSEGCITIKKRYTAANANEAKELKEGKQIRVRGVVGVDRFNNEIYVNAHYIDIIEDVDVVEPENIELSRVELHCHSNMSAQDALDSPTALFKHAKALGHKALAITDHGVIQGFPEAEEISEKTGVKAIYGCEFNMVEKPKYIFNPCKTKLNNAHYIVIDLESTGLSTRYDRVIEFGAQKIENGRVIDSLDILINPGCELSNKIIDITDITNEMLVDKPSFKEVMSQILEFISDGIIVTHNASFDFPLLNQEIIRNGGSPLTNAVIDTLGLYIFINPKKRSHALKAMCNYYKVNYESEKAHRADYDAAVLGECWLQMIDDLTKDHHVKFHEDLDNLPISNELLTSIRELHIIALAKNKEGLRAIYELVSLSHIDYMAGLPKVPRDEIIKRRKNLLLGSACLNGEVFRSARYDTEDILKEKVKFYDYIELQPKENYSCLTNIEELTEERLEQYHKDIIKCADECGIPVVATGDVHYINPQQKQFREIYIGLPTVGKGNHPLKVREEYYQKYGYFDSPSQHFRTTKEMLEAFDFLGKEKAYEIVVTNTNKIADLIEPLVIIPKKVTFAPKIDGVEDILKNLVYKKLHEIYGEHPDPEVQERCDIELKRIIDSGYPVVYYYAHMIVKKANDDGFIVGSRGSVGSSFVATLAGITEVNPLRPHYICTHCHHFEWSDKEFPEALSGYDLPTKICPVCGQKMINEGQNIPFETFLGAENEKKVPDIDLNFARDYQSRAHDYSRELLGDEHIFRAGTIGTVAFKTAMGYVKKYITDIRHMDLSHFSQAKLEYFASGCIGVKKTTGRHAGGVIVVPLDRNVNEFTPVQYPADDITSTWKTTHFDYNSMHELLLKFDLLGQLEPMVIKFCCDLTGVKDSDIPLNDKDVFSLFTSVDALKLKRNYMQQTTGILGLPEFGTNFVKGIIEKTKPTTFQQLVIIQGLSHGTDVWNGNAKDLIDSGIADINGIIGCRDDIMTYLQRMGLSKDNAFSIMETVRKKDKTLTEEQKELMRAVNVPEWYIQSANKVKYLFPKAHAAAYTIMALRTGYFKVHYPLEYYAAYLSIKTDKFDVASMVAGEDSVIEKLAEIDYKAKGLSDDKMTDKDKQVLESLQVALEMLERGYKFSKINLYKSDVKNFVVDKENNVLIPPFCVVDGLGEANASSVIEARKEGEFASIEDLQKRTKLTQTNINDLRALGVLEGMNETDQIKLFDFDF